MTDEEKHEPRHGEKQPLEGRQYKETFGFCGGAPSVLKVMKESVYSTIKQGFKKEDKPHE